MFAVKRRLPTRPFPADPLHQARRRRHVEHAQLSTGGVVGQQRAGQQDSRAEFRRFDYLIADRRQRRPYRLGTDVGLAERSYLLRTRRMLAPNAVRTSLAMEFNDCRLRSCAYRQSTVTKLLYAVILDEPIRSKDEFVNRVVNQELVLQQLSSDGKVNFGFPRIGTGDRFAASIFKVHY